MSYRSDLGIRTFPKPDGTSWTGVCVATDEHVRPPFAPPGPDEEGIELGTDQFMKLGETPKGHDAYTQGVTHPDAQTRVGLVADFAAGTLTVTFDPGTPQAALIGVCRAQ